MLTCDHREHLVIEAYDGARDVDFVVADLPVGDYLVTYEGQPNKTWIAERKAHDFGQSIKSGRWSDQIARLHATGHRVVIIIEGSLREGSLPQKCLMGALINASMRKGFTVYRTWDYWETAFLLKQLVEKMACWGSSVPPITSGLVQSKRKRDADNTHLRMLSCIPTISESVAEALLKHFGDIPSLQEALSSGERFPQISLGKTSVGKARVSTLKKFLCKSA
jgi:ERCC4-type nuclease